MTTKNLVKIIGVALVLIAAALVLVAWEVSQADQAHQALCVMKHDDQRMVAQSRQYLRMSPKARVKKYGESLGSIPKPLIQSGIRSHKADLRALRDLHC
jgi:hypothetical protein